MITKNRNRVVIATTTSYPSNSESDLCRAELALKFAREAKRKDYMLLIVDKNSPDSLLAEFRKNNALVHNQERESMGSGRRQAFQAAYDTGREIIVWTEPEKTDFVRSIEYCAEPILKGEADAVIPKRKSLDSYPVFQRHSETLGNLLFGEITNTSIDIFFGPRVFKRDLTHYFTDYDGRYGDLWDSINIPVLGMIFDKNRIESRTVDYCHPNTQTRLEEHNLEIHKKRIYQLANTLKSLEDYWNLLNSQKNR